MSNHYFLPQVDYNTSIATTTISASNTTASVPMFTLTGSVRVLRVTGVVTTALSSNITAAHIRMNDQTNTPAVTVATGTTLSSAPAGSVLSKTGLAAAAIVLNTSAQVDVIEHATSGLAPDCPFDLAAKAGVANTMDFRYTTTNTPATGAISWRVDWLPLSSDGNLS